MKTILVILVIVLSIGVEWQMGLIHEAQEKIHQLKILASTCDQDVPDQPFNVAETNHED